VCKTDVNGICKVLGKVCYNKKYPETMKIKKAFFGGVDKTDVYARLHDIMELYKELINQQ